MKTEQWYMYKKRNRDTKQRNSATKTEQCNKKGTVMQIRNGQNSNENTEQWYKNGTVVQKRNSVTKTEQCNKKGTVMQINTEWTEQ